MRNPSLGSECRPIWWVLLDSRYTWPSLLPRLSFAPGLSLVLISSCLVFDPPGAAPGTSRVVFGPALLGGVTIARTLPSRRVRSLA
ncbi:MAG: hypothetical protein ACI9UA_006166 [Pseudoalteromonas tetraodonis]|jgi:hypothetical protein